MTSQSSWKQGHVTSHPSMLFTANKFYRVSWSQGTTDDLQKIGEDSMTKAESFLTKIFKGCFYQIYSQKALFPTEMLNT